MDRHAPRLRCIHGSAEAGRLTLVQHFYGAGNETRTRDIFLGKEVLYQLSYTRECVSTKARADGDSFNLPFGTSSFLTVCRQLWRYGADYRVRTDDP